MKILPHTVIEEYGDSRAEFSFIWELRKHTSAKIEAQYPVGPYRLDFVIFGQDTTLGVEIDGKEWHKDKDRDSKRDKRILDKDRSIDAIVRFEGHDAAHNPMFCVVFLSTFFPRIFLVPDYPDDGRKYHSGSEIDEPRKYKVSTDHLIRIHQSKLHIQGIYSISEPAINEMKGYKVFRHSIEFMTPENQNKYLYDSETSSYEGKSVDSSNYTYTKQSRVLIMYRDA